MLVDLFELVYTAACGSLSSHEKNGLTEKVFLHYYNTLIPVKLTRWSYKDTPKLNSYKQFFIPTSLMARKKKLLNSLAVQLVSEYWLIDRILNRPHNVNQIIYEGSLLVFGAGM